jgi:hypothetical protein
MTSRKFYDATGYGRIYTDTDGTTYVVYTERWG